MCEQPSPKPLVVNDRLVLLLAQGVGFGRSPWMPGTVGSLWGLPLGWLLGLGFPWWARLLMAAAMFVVGVPLCGRAARLLGKDDPGSVVWDEIAAFPLVYAFVPVTPASLLLGFVLFRIFDITKPPPIRSFEQLHGGLGIMIDDTLAACWAVLGLLLLQRFTDWI